MRKPLPTEDLDFVVERTVDIWSAFERARLFIAGGTGFVGSWLLEVVQHANRVTGSRIEVVALSRDPRKAKDHAPHLFQSGDVTLLEGDVTDFDTHVGAFDLCIHAATDVADPAKTADPMRMFDTCVRGTRRMLDCARFNGATHFLLTSSGAIYGKQPADLRLMPETFSGAPDPLDTGSAYGQGKRAAEWLASACALQSDLHVSIARIYALIGPAMPLDGPFAAGNFIRDALTGRQIQINGDGRTVRSYLYMADACVWLLRIMLYGERGQAYNVGSEYEIPIGDLARLIDHLCGANYAVFFPQTFSGVSPPRYVPDTSKARHTLGLEPTTSLETALFKTINWNRRAAAV